MLKLNRVLFVFSVVLLLSVSAHSDDRSLWQKVVDFFSPTPTVTCEGPVCDEVRELDKRIGKVEGRYSRERRPVHKTRLKKEMDSLQVVRDSLWETVNVRPLNDSVAVQLNADTAKVEPAKVEAVKAEAVKAETMACVHDTVYVRDTVVVHDTLYVMLANKPAPAAPVETAPVSSDSVELSK